MSEIVDIIALNPEKLAFLSAFREFGTVREAAHAIGVREIEHYWWMRDAAYAEEFRQALASYGERLEAEARRRALDGVERLDSKGRTYRHYSDILLIFLLKGIFPHKYRDNINVSTDSQAQAIANELGVSQDEVKKAMAEGRQMLALK